MEGKSLVVGWLVFKFMSIAPHPLPNPGTVWGSALWCWMLDAGDLWHLFTNTVTPRTFSVSTEIKEKEKGCKEGNEPAQIYEKASILEVNHIVSAQKVQVESRSHDSICT